MSVTSLAHSSLAMTMDEVETKMFISLFVQMFFSDLSFGR